MLATTKQKTYLQYLTDRADVLKGRHPSLFPLGLYPKDWANDNHLTSERASLCIQFYSTILGAVNAVLYRPRAKKVKGDLPA